MAADQIMQIGTSTDKFLIEVSHASDSCPPSEADPQGWDSVIVALVRPTCDIDATGQDCWAYWPYSGNSMIRTDGVDETKQVAWIEEEVP